MSTESSLRSVLANNLLPDHDLNAFNGGILVLICIHLPTLSALTGLFDSNALLAPAFIIAIICEFTGLYFHSYLYIPFILYFLPHHKSTYPPNRLYQTSSFLLSIHSLLYSLTR